MKKLLLAALLFTASPALAQITPPIGGSEPVPLNDFKQRGHVTLNGGVMVLTAPQDWSGMSLGGTVLYNVHPRFSLFAGYDHGFPVNSVDPHLNLYRGVGSLRVHPNAFIGFGYAWFDHHTDGALAQLVISKEVMPRIAVGGLYAHIFSRGEVEDFEYFRVYVNYHLFGRE